MCHLAEVRVLVDWPGAAVGTRKVERHPRQLPYAQPCARIRNDGTSVSRTRQPSSRRIGAAERAIALLDTLADAGELGTNEIARRTGMTPSTVSRQLGTLAASGLVERVAATGRYRLVRIVQLANALLARLDVRAVARPHLEELVRVTGETATLSVPGEEDAVTIDFVSGSHQIQPVSRLGRPSVAYATSAGKVMLAFSGRTLPAEPYRAYTPRTITDSKALVREIERVRERGYAQAIEEREPGLSAIAVPVRSSRGELDAIVALQGPSSRFDKKAIGAALPVLLEQGRAISRELGWRAD
ncbi:MAG: IclR family transcriptional regulator [Actinobacteria bacterium]|nr:MAG: IclR family transcriptional regulator [Actinomycetota bacterium]